MSEEKKPTPAQSEIKVPAAPRAEAATEFRELIRIIDRDIPGNTAIFMAMTKVKGIDFMMANAICNVLNVNRTEKCGNFTHEQIEKIEDVESAPAPKESEGATEVARKERVETSKRSDYGVMIELLDLLVVNDRKPYSDAELSDMVEEGRKDIENRYGEDALTPDRVKGLLEILGAIPGMLDEKSSAALSKNPEVRKEITHGLCEPFLRGHLEPGEILYLVQKIEVKPISETTSESKSITGY